MTSRDVSHATLSSWRICRDSYTFNFNVFFATRRRSASFSAPGNEGPDRQQRPLQKHVLIGGPSRIHSRDLHVRRLRGRRPRLLSSECKVKRGSAKSAGAPPSSYFDATTSADALCDLMRLAASARFFLCARALLALRASFCLNLSTSSFSSCSARLFFFFFVVFVFIIVFFSAVHLHNSDSSRSASAGRLWRAAASARRRWQVVPGRHHLMGHRLRRTKPSRRVHSHLQIQELDRKHRHLDRLGMGARCDAMQMMIATDRFRRRPSSAASARQRAVVNRSSSDLRQQ